MNIRFNNKGFTLIEVLAVVVILGILATIMVPTITTIISKNNEDNYNNLKKSIVSAAKIYISDNRYNITLENTTCSNTIKTRKIVKINDVSLSNSHITLNILVDSGDLSTNVDGKIKNSSTGNNIKLDNSYVEVKYNCSTKDYDFGDPVINDE